MKKIIVVIALIFAYGYANAQCNNWQLVNGNEQNIIINIRTNPVNGETWKVKEQSWGLYNFFKYNESLNKWDSITNISQNVSDIEFNSDGDLYIGTDSSIYIIPFGGDTVLSWAYDTGLYFGSNTEIIDMAFDSDDNLWIAQEKYGASSSKEKLQKFDESSHAFENYSISATGAVNDSYQVIRIDEDDNVWIVYSNYMDDPGIVGYNSVSWTHYNTFGLFTAEYNDVPEIDVDDDNILYLSFLDNSQYNKHIFSFDGSSWTELGTNISASHMTCVDENLWYSYSNYPNYYLFMYNTNTQNIDTFQVIPGNGAIIDNVVALYYDDSSILWTALSDSIYKINMSAEINVLVDYNGTALTDTDVEVELFSNGIIAFTGIDSLLGNLNYSGSGFDFTTMETNLLYLRANVKSSSSYYNTLINSYYSLLPDSNYKWENAAFLNLGTCEDTTITINMYALTTIPSGSGDISGNISYGVSGGTKAQGEPVPGIQVLVEQEPNDDPVAYAVSDSSGDYSVANTAEIMNFHLVVDVPGIPQIETYNTQFTSTNHTANNLNFIVDTTGVYIDSLSSVKTFNSELFNVNIYPNPSTSDFSLNYKIIRDSDVEIKLVDSKSAIIREVSRETKPVGEYKLEFNNLKSGVYFVQMRVGNIMYAKKVVIVN